MCLCLGSPSIVSLTLDQQDSSLICVSTGGPATTVIWKRNDIIILSDGNGDYQQIQTVLDTQTATYENKLFSNELVGNFTCTVINSRGRAETMLLLNGNDNNNGILLIITLVASSPGFSQFFNVARRKTRESLVSNCM